MVEGNQQALRVTSDGRLKLEFHGSEVTSDAGLTRPSGWQSLEGHVGTAAACRLVFEKSI